ncbi:MAG: pilus assembly protein PilM [Planctomycetota bacterium]
MTTKPARAVAKSIDAIIALEADRFSAVSFSASRGAVRVRNWATGSRPEDVDAADANSVGEWLKAELRAAGVNAKSAAVLVPRGSVILKPLTLPIAADADIAELAGLVRLRLSRELPIPLDAAAVDFVVGRHRSPASDTADRPVLAAAVPVATLDWARDAVQAAGVKVPVVGVRSQGTACLADAQSDETTDETTDRTTDQPILAISVTPRAAELAIIANGNILHSRGIDLPGGEPSPDRIAVEAKRTWMSSRAAADAPDIAAIRVLGDSDTERNIADACSQALDLPANALPLPASIKFSKTGPPTEAAQLAPLLGMALLLQTAPESLINLASPRRAPDRFQAKRQAVLLAVLGLIAAGGIGWTIGNLQMKDARADYNTALDTFRELSVDNRQLTRLRATAEHAERWHATSPDWLYHLERLAMHLPADGNARLAGITGRFTGGVGFERGSSRSYADGSWISGGVASFDIRGATRSRDAALAIRAAIVNDDLYRVENTAPDTGPTFNLVARSSQLQPPPEPQDATDSDGGES